ncbi:hypothetical protein ScalyP_jg1030 [Parmales sp. scaly parma]|nr:hypothetical protein ScalyP_jg1030 [Parmales sp. scaly parma]
MNVVGDLFSALFGQANNADMLLGGFSGAGLGGAYPGTSNNPSFDSTAPPPASEKSIRQLPQISVTADDLLDEANKECCVCLESHSIGSNATRLPCGHLFHRPCIENWITKNCTCPVCRFELETDNASYEVHRKERMASRKPRFHKHDLDRLTVRELKSLLSSFQIPTDGLIDKEELKNALCQSGKIDLIASAPPTHYKYSELKSMRVRALRKLMDEAGVGFNDVDVVEKDDMIALFVNSGRVAVDPEMDLDVEVEVEVELDNKRLKSFDGIDSSNIQISFNDLKNYSISNLRILAENLGVDLSSCLEKDDIANALVNSGLIMLVAEAEINQNSSGEVGETLD